MEGLHGTDRFVTSSNVANERWRLQAARPYCVGATMQIGLAIRIRVAESLKLPAGTAMRRFVGLVRRITFMTSAPLHEGPAQACDVELRVHTRPCHDRGSSGRSRTLARSMLLISPSPLPPVDAAPDLNAQTVGHAARTDPPTRPPSRLAQWAATRRLVGHRGCNTRSPSSHGLLRTGCTSDLAAPPRACQLKYTEACPHHSERPIHGRV